jgi:hypothetical protein
VANCDDLSFAPTTPEKFAVTLVIQDDNVSPSAAIGELGSAVHGSCSDAMRELHLCLAQQPPAVARAAECALYIIALVGESEGEGTNGEAEIEIASACIDKVSRAAHQVIDALMHGPLHFPPNPEWRRQFAAGLAMCKICNELGAEDEGWEAIADVLERWQERLAASALKKAEPLIEPGASLLSYTPAHLPAPDDNVMLSDREVEALRREKQGAKDAAVLECLMGIEQIFTFVLEVRVAVECQGHCTYPYLTRKPKPRTQTGTLDGGE